MDGGYSLASFGPLRRSGSGLSVSSEPSQCTRRSVENEGQRTVMELRPGMRLHSTVCDTEVVVVKAPSAEVELCCGGYPMAGPEDSHDGEITVSGGTVLGKRYEHEPTGLELLCTKAGAGALTAAGDVLQVKAPKPLPSSD